MKSILTLVFFAILNFSFAATIEVQNTNDSGAGSMRQSVIDASEGDTIRFNPNLIASGSDTILLTSAAIDVNKGLVFVGLYNSVDTLYFSGGNTINVLNVNLNTALDKSLVLDSMIFIDSYSIIGGAVQTVAPESVVIKNCVFRNCSAWGGGALYVETQNAIVATIENSKFQGNEASSDLGGAIKIYSQTTDARIYVSDSDFEGNSAWIVGGAISLQASDTGLVQLTNCNFNSNTVYPGSGGAVYCSSSSNTDAIVIADSCDFIANTANGNGGAIMSQSGSGVSNSTVTLTNCTLIGNEAQASGGVLSTYTNTGSANFFIDNCIVQDNWAGNYGGAFHNEAVNPSEVQVLNSDLDSNHANFKGGAIYTKKASVHIDACSFYGNSTDSTGGAVCANPLAGGTLNITRSTFKGSVAGYFGGAVYSELNTSVNTSTFNDNTIIESGGAMAVINKDLEITNSTFAQNTTFFNSGGAVYFNDGASNTLSLGSSIISDNGGGTAGGILVESAAPIISFGYNIFTYNQLGAVTSDQVVQVSEVNLAPLANNGGPTMTMLPQEPSVAIDMGNPNDLTDAQNITIEDGVRDVGAAEVGCHTDSSLAVSAFCSYVSPSGIVYNTSGIYMDTIPNAEGCDSLLTIDLTINQVNVNVTNNDPTLAAEESNATYQWIDCDNNQAIPGEVNQTFAASANGNYAVIVTVGGCSDTSACQVVQTIGVSQLELLDVSMYPNPTSGELVVKLDREYPELELRCVNALGAVQSEWTFRDSSILNVELSGEPGVYFLELIIDGEKVTSERIVKMK